MTLPEVKSELLSEYNYIKNAYKNPHNSREQRISFRGQLTALKMAISLITQCKEERNTKTENISNAANGNACSCIANGKS
jgi:hypothetical protein